VNSKRTGTTQGIVLPYRGQNPPKLPSAETLAALPEGLCRQLAVRSTMVWDPRV